MYYFYIIYTYNCRQRAAHVASSLMSLLQVAASFFYKKKSSAGRKKEGERGWGVGKKSPAAAVLAPKKKACP
jgi:hypothetical protein